ncbi:AAA domain-containing protein [Flocculibacter collagenilyticus]|uniref:AAA domain-containing protein n=1 Tax=Flocculibacter collagenilyticus TaxID=2744479 RepID=UPI0018F73262|nr:ATP-binding protein [Flocculibacter collagenilyticus]
MLNIKNTLSYYRDCYKEDSADLNLWNLTKLNSEDYLILEGQDDLGSGFLPRLPIPESFASQMIKRINLYQRERVLLYARFMITGRLEINGEVKTVVAPLVFNEAEIIKDKGDYYFSLKSHVLEINESLIQTLLPEGNSTLQDDNLGDYHSPSYWTALLKNSPHKLNLVELLNYPSLVDAKALKRALRQKIPSLLPASVLAFVERSKSNRGILHELETIISSDTLSPPLANLFDTSNTPYYQKKLKYDYLPGLLSISQKKVISIAANASLGCVSGPPGTGKTYTIAAIAAEHIARGESVLIVANNETALDVISEKLEGNFNLGDVSIRAGQSEFLKKLKSYISDLLSGYYSNDIQTHPITCESELSEINNTLNKLEKRFIKYCQKTVYNGQRIKRLDESNSRWMKSIYLAFTRNEIHRLTQEWSSLEKINSKQSIREKLASNYLNAIKNENLKTLVETHRKSLQAFNKAIRSRTSKKQFEQFNDIEYSALLSAFPVWLVSLNSLYRVLPLKAEMFDLVIIDEATQCNITSCLPALYRAKRAIVIGDTKQLKHYSFLAKNKEAQLLSKNNVSTSTNGVLSYRDNSILDLALCMLNSHQQLAFLDEHFRSKPEIIHFSNHSFYQNKLKVMQHRPCTSSGYLHVKRVNGIRNNAGINEIEASHLIESIKQQINEDGQTGLIHSIGVISPFRHQAEYLSKTVNSCFTESEITKHKIRVATPFGFQGEERDVMFISFAVDNNSKRTTAYLNREDVFNVTITRARQKQVLFLSIDEATLSESNLLKRYMNSVGQFKAIHLTKPQLDEFQNEIISELKKLKIETWSGYTIAGVEIDILCKHKDKYLALDLIGYPGPWEGFFELDTYKIFKRAGIEVLPISYSLWVINRSVCKEKIVNMLGANQI